MAPTASGLAIPVELRPAYEGLAENLASAFGPRLEALVAFGPRLRAAAARPAAVDVPQADALALVDRVTMDDLTACSAHAAGWSRNGLRVPLLLGRDEFLRSLDAFPLEYDDIIAHHVMISGSDPFSGVSVAAEDLRRGCEARAKGHLVHLREGFLEARGRGGDVATLILASASPFSALLGSLARLQGITADTADERAATVSAVAGLSMSPVKRVLALELQPALTPDEAVRLYPEYLAAVQQLVVWVDAWSRS